MVFINASFTVKLLTVSSVMVNCVIAVIFKILLMIMILHFGFVLSKAVISPSRFELLV